MMRYIALLFLLWCVVVRNLITMSHRSVLCVFVDLNGVVVCIVTFIIVPSSPCHHIIFRCCVWGRGEREREEREEVASTGSVCAGSSLFVAPWCFFVAVARHSAIIPFLAGGFSVVSQYSVRVVAQHTHKRKKPSRFLSPLSFCLVVLCGSFSVPSKNNPPRAGVRLLCIKTSTTRCAAQTILMPASTQQAQQRDHITSPCCAPQHPLRCCVVDLIIFYDVWGTGA